MQRLSNWLNRYLKYGVAAILLAVPLYPKFPFIRIPLTYVSIRLEDFLVLTVGLCSLIILAREIPRLAKSGLERTMFIFLLINFFSLLSGILLTQTVVPAIGFLHWLRRVEYFVPFFIALAVFKQKNSALLEFFLKLLMIVYFVAFIYGVGQRYLHWPVIITQNEEYAKGIALRWVPGSHINSTFAGHYDLATFIVLTLPIFVNLLILLKNRKTKLILSLIMVSGYWLMANAVSRISVVSLMLALTISLLIIRKPKELLIVLFIGFIAFGFSPDLRARYLRLFDVTKIKLKQLTKFSLFTNKVVLAQSKNEYSFPLVEISSPSPTPLPIFEDRSTSIRFNVEWPRAIRAFSKNPFLGTGYSSITLATDNDYLRFLGETGILGFFSFLLIIFRLVGLMIKGAKKILLLNEIDRGFLAGFMGGLAGVLVNAFFIDVFEASKLAIIFWLLCGFAVYLVRNKNYE